MSSKMNEEKSETKDDDLPQPRAITTIYANEKIKAGIPVKLSRTLLLLSKVIGRRYEGV